MKKKLIIVGIVLLVITAIIAAITLPPTFSKRSFEGIVQETVTQQDGEVRLIVQRTTEVYADPFNSLHISKDTALLGIDGKTISIEDIAHGTIVEVTLKDSFVEERPFYYPTVYTIKVISTVD